MNYSGHALHVALECPTRARLISGGVFILSSFDVQLARFDMKLLPKVRCSPIARMSQ
jgi:hypothetical protein